MISLSGTDPLPVDPRPSTSGVVIEHNPSELKNVLDSIPATARAIIGDIFLEAIMKKCDGEKPSKEEMKKRGMVAVAEDGVLHLFWDHPAVGVGSKLDFNYCISSVETFTV